ncbi:MAG: hypothetical protein RLZZ104_1080 [Pseudomonadota bacterium]|jgi:hypothetical protein
MNAVEIQEAIEELIQQPYAPSAFIEGFMTANGASATTIARIKSGDGKATVPPNDVFWKAGAGEGIRTLDPSLGKIRIYEISDLNQLFKRPPKHPNTIRTFSLQFARKALCAMF